MSSGASSAGPTNFKHPYEIVNEFWENLLTKKPGKADTISPPSLYANPLPPRRQRAAAHGCNASESDQAAAEECRARVKRIVQKCQRENEKFTDPDFDIESDTKTGRLNCLKGLLASLNDDDNRPGSSSLAVSNTLGTPTVFSDLNALAASFRDNDESGQFYIPGSVHRVDWIFKKPAFVLDGYSSSDVRQGATGDCWLISAVASLCSDKRLMDRICVVQEEECGVYGFVFHRDGEWISTVMDDNLYLGSSDFDAFGDSWDPLPLLEKSYAKAHGDYGAIQGRDPGEGVEDLTGGVTTEIRTSRILSKVRLWQELLEVNKRFLFSVASPGAYGEDSPFRKAWPQFGDDGIFWMSYHDFLIKFELTDRTRLFDEGWTVVQQWISVCVSWVTGYLNTKFVVEVKEGGPTVVVLSQKKAIPKAEDKPEAGRKEAEEKEARKLEKAEQGDAVAAEPKSAKKQNPWNAATVIGLRVYAKDKEVKLTLVKPKGPEGAASLDVDGRQAGATM
ncbi:cysteine proteinase [Delitschia confertaspora ATCC 74209]|uniref:Cysteine proteinase n=1 Tax=Delitschia confertaspora ATCC 74209 TaxID=1513339 RepID=A0A9P4MPZ9_9PLEO|nr:cysteine proteinase [Delitschia confertaspora ATCC 74209]